MFRRIFCVVAAVIILIFGSTAYADGVERGMVLGEIMRALDLPLKTGKTFSDVNEATPYHAEMESALSLGILYPSDDFSPEIPCANAEALMFALQAMGFRHEAETAVWALPIPDEKLPAHISGYVALAKTIKPDVPKSVADNPWGSITMPQLREVLRWVRACNTSVVWDYEISRPEGTLRLHRENVGRPPASWRVQFGVFEVESNARALAEKLDTPECPVLVINREFDFVVATPPFADRMDAHKAKVKTRYKGSIIRPEAGESNALFWTSFIPTNAAEAVIRMNRAISHKALGKLSKIAEANNALIAVNGGYFSSSGAIGTIFADGMPVSLPYYNRSMVAWSDKGEIYFGGGEFRSRLTVNGGAPFTISINTNTNYGNTSILTPAFGLSAKRAGNNGLVARVHDGTVVEVSKALTFKRDMRTNEWLIVTRDPKLEFKVGDGVALKTQWRTYPPFEVTNAVQAGPLIYAPGHKFSDETLSSNIINRRHPRTLIGSDGTNMVLIVVDGRSAWHSRGLTISEAASLGKKLGLISLLNLDGGGSSEMWWNGHVVNEVSDGRERSMPYGILVMKN